MVGGGGEPHFHPNLGNVLVLEIKISTGLAKALKIPSVKKAVQCGLTQHFPDVLGYKAPSLH